MGYKEEIQLHYERVWKSTGVPRYWYKGPIEKLNSDFCVLEFSASETRKMWTYATCCMSSEKDDVPVELHIFSSKQDDKLIELLTIVAFYYKNDSKLDLNHTVNFGQSWQDDSKCEYGLISLPYLDGPNLENGTIQKRQVKFYWLIPITKYEVDFKIKQGIEELESRFENVGIDYINPKRASVV